MKIITLTSGESFWKPLENEKYWHINWNVKPTPNLIHLRHYFWKFKSEWKKDSENECKGGIYKEVILQRTTENNPSIPMSSYKLKN